MDSSLPERDFARALDGLHGRPGREAQLLALVREDHPIYAQRSSAATARMRGWVLLALSRTRLPDEALLCVVEELDNGRTPYLVAAAARALRSATPSPAMARFVVQALINIRDRDEYLDLDVYGGAVLDEGRATAFDELIDTLHWLGKHAAGVVGDAESLCGSRDRPLSRQQVQRLQGAVRAIRAASSEADTDCCGDVPAAWGAFRRWLSLAGPTDVDGIEFEDQEARRISYREFFRGRPAVVVFFYTRCDNANKCSLSVAQLARVQQLLSQAGMGGRVRTAAITYDPAYDIPSRLRPYAQSRGMRLDDDHRAMRVAAGAPALALHFRPGVNFVGSVVNRHRIEVYLLDRDGRVSASFERIRWDPEHVAAEAIRLAEQPAAPRPVVDENTRQGTAALLSVALALFPKCPLCGATYLSLSGIAALPYLPPAYWLFPVLVLALAANLASLWRLARLRGAWGGFVLATGGASLVLAFGVAWEHRVLMLAGMAMSVAGSLAGVMQRPAGQDGGRRRPMSHRLRDLLGTGLRFPSR